MRSFGGAAALVLALAQQVAGHAFMAQPASRMGHAYDAQPRTEFEPWSAGGLNGRAPCGKIGGHDYTDDAWNSGHAATHQKIVKGGVLQLETIVSTHHWGHVEFSICDLDTIGPFEGTAAEQKAKKDAALWDCFNHRSNLLERARDFEVYDPAPIDNAHPTRWYLPPADVTSWPPQGWTGAPTLPSNGKTIYRMWMKVPTTANCDGDNCVLFYFYYATNSCEGKGYSEFMVNQAPVQVKNYFNDHSADKRWTCNNCGLCSAIGADDGAVHDGMRAFHHLVSLGTPERFYGCADVSTTTGHVLTLPPASSAPWCAEQVCDGSATHAPTWSPTTAAPQETVTNAPTMPPTTAAPQEAVTNAPTMPPTTAAPLQQGATAAPTTLAPTSAATQGGASCSSWCSQRAHNAAIQHCGTCSPSFCQGNHVMNCPAGLVFSHTLSVCNWPWAETQDGQSCSA